MRLEKLSEVPGGMLSFRSKADLTVLPAGAERGLLAGYPVTDFRASLAGFGFGGADPGPCALQAAARGAFQILKTAANPRLTEPSVDLTI
ncbi:hypothetical protein [Hyphomonas sp.]|uniref:hypothetical protein n=1 Tax=Hyphomonas sp. TaxID=87 RepID=UPI0025B939DB|nr:hypothetical protein [Hyphomonas sp.]